MSCHVFAGRFRSRQGRTVGKKSENGRCKLTKNRNAKPLIIRQDVKKGNNSRWHDQNEKKKAPKPCNMLQRFLTKLNEYPL